jgi:hypothetical protein
MTRFIQICASQNNLFALDEDGEVYQDHFNVKAWVKLALRPGAAGRGPLLTPPPLGPSRHGGDPARPPSAPSCL